MAGSPSARARGENLNEHIIGGQWPLTQLRHEMLGEAAEIIRALWAGGTLTYRGKHFEAESAKVWDLPDTAPPIGIAVSGQVAVRSDEAPSNCFVLRT